ncbi:hypothetical protein Agub_g6816 [Astrephomene gubernaculifera]|uniref:SGNH/GDSL hydrolase family protein n=1 Tax=Astrephomene gubernaculifera TaxID=47775 RepID=A0AAD3DR51_9CHLO|nr:hypothetical protein Agub_g6816 [Astrephomene gubernaculifera]
MKREISLGQKSFCLCAWLIVASLIALCPQLLEGYEAPINPPLVSGLCRYGEEPGTWLDLPSNADLRQYPLQRVSFIPDGKLPQNKVGGRWSLYNKDCKLSNRLRADIFDQSPTPIKPRTHVFFIGDSNDVHTLEYICNQYAREQHINITRDVQCPPMPCLRTGSVPLAGVEPNYCLTERFHAYQRFVPTANKDRVDLNEIVDSLKFYLDRYSKVQEPQLVVIGLEFWEVARLAWDANRTYDQVNTEHHYLPLRWLASFVQNYTSLVSLVRQKLPSALIVARTNAFPRYDCLFGLPPEEKRWAKKMFIAQMHGAIRYTARQLNLPLIDIAAMSEGLVPEQYLNDDIHTVQWLNVESFNIALNYLHQYTAVMGRGGKQQELR